MKLYNSLSRQTEEFQPLTSDKVTLYTCGLTVYSQPHIGNWVSYIYWDVLVRALQTEGYQVRRVQNITDVGHLTDDADEGEDKLAKGARREQTTAWEVAEKYSKIAEAEAEQLGLITPDEMPRATEYIEQQIDWNKKLQAAGYTYEIDGKGLYFDTSKLDDYGKLATVDLDQLQSGKRIDDTGKKNPTDFVVWRLSPEGLDPAINWEWDSPWGKGIPGWHLECSVMANQLLGDQIDIHTGGIDHINVHHTNEIAQTEAITNKQFAQYWLHNNHLKINGTKMSKSLGNLYTLDDIIDHGYSIDAFKLMVISSHYRTEGNFTWKIMEAAQNRLSHWLRAADLRWQDVSADNDTRSAAETIDSIQSALSNDLNTPQAIKHIDDFVAEALSYRVNSEAIEQVFSAVRDLLGINLLHGDITDDIKQLLQERSEARQNKDWDKSDQLREELENQGVIINDTDTGQYWHRELNKS